MINLQPEPEEYEVTLVFPVVLCEELTEEEARELAELLAVDEASEEVQA